jgi:hypothetical protein
MNLFEKQMDIVFSIILLSALIYMWNMNNFIMTGFVIIGSIVVIAMVNRYLKAFNSVQSCQKCNGIIAA